MKLETTGYSIMFTASLILLAGCKHKSGYEQLVSQMDGAKAIKTQYVVHVKGRTDVTVDFLFAKPNRFLATSADFVVDSNETDGHFEMVHSLKLYDHMPWDEMAYPGTGKIVPTEFLQGGPLSGKNPKDFAPDYKWVSKGASNGQETYVKTIPTQNGPQDYTLIVSTEGRPVKFLAPGNVEYQVKSFEYVDAPSLEAFHVEPKDNYVCIRTQYDQVALHTGEKFDWSVFKAASDVANFKFDGDTLFTIVDPQEPTSKGAIEWAAKPGSGYKKVSISKGQAATGLYDPDGKWIDKLTTTTPTFLLVGKDKTIKGMWLGFDPEGIAKFEKDISMAMKGEGGS